MIFTSSTKLMGGLGNYLFQIAAALAVSLRDNKKLVVDTSDIQIVHDPLENYKDNILRRITFRNGIDAFIPINQNGFHFSEIPKIENNTKLFGYFQTEKYFEEFSDHVRSIFEMTPQIRKHLKTKYENDLNDETCSIHVRRTNYLKFPQHHPVLDVDYYKEAVSIIGDEKLYLIFSDDLLWCKENFGFIKNKVFIENQKDYEDLYLMSLCDDNIIANSSFSWWGAWLNKNENKKVIAPKQWFGTAYSHWNLNDLYCKKWIKL